jgi:hypothetical protein
MNLIKLAAIAVSVTALGYLFFPDHEEAEPPVATLRDERLTPEIIAQQEEALRQAALEREKTYKQQDAARAMNGLKTSELLFEGAETDLKKGTISGDMDVYTIGVMLEIMYSTASALQTAWNNQSSLSPSDNKELKSVEARLSSFQQRALPKMRLAFKKRTAETLWPHDVAVTGSGVGNTTLKLIGYQYDRNANVQATFDQLSELTTRLRYKEIIIAPSEHYRGGAVYTLKTPADGAIAAYSGGFQKLGKTQK